MSAWPSIALAACFGAGVVVAAPTDPDPSFGSGGVARIAGATSNGSGALHPDGGLVIPVGDATTDPPSSRVLKLDQSGVPNAGFAPILAPPPNTSAGEISTSVGSIAVLLDGRFVVTQYRTRSFLDRSVQYSYLTRHLVDGTPDRSFGDGEPVQAGSGFPVVAPTVSATGVVYLPSYAGLYSSWWSSIVRVGSTGSPIEALDTQSWPGGMRWTHGRVALTRSLQPVAVANVTSERGLGAVRILGLSPDPSFGTGTGLNRGGLAFSPTTDHATGTDVALAEDERVVVAGVGFRGNVAQVVVARFTADGRIDESFGTDGLAYVASSRAGGYFTDARIALQGDGRILIAATFNDRHGDGSPFPRITLVRLTSTGQPDTSFAGGGVAELWTQRGSWLAFLALRPDGRIIVGTTNMLAPVNGQGASEATVLQLRGGDLGTPHPWRERRAVEYFDERSGHYFLTASEVEIALLDTTLPPTWRRTGQTFNVYDEPTAPLSPVCRFWSDQSFAPKSSHFYTPYAHECELLQRGSVWRYEGVVFQLRLPEGAAGSKACPSGTQPLYRAYNNNLSGAPNHRYMIDAALLDGMIGQGWTMEGEAGTRVFACVPLQQRGSAP